MKLLLKRSATGSHSDVAHLLRTLGLMLLHPMAYSVSSAQRASKVSPVVMTMLMLHNCDEGVGRLEGSVESRSS